MRFFLRSLIGPLLLGFSAWCAAGALSLVDPAMPGVRVVAAASPLWALGGIVLGLCVPGCRRFPACSTPALLSVVPWLPLPMPLVALLWTGRLAWLPVGLAVVSCLMRASAEGPARASLEKPAWRPAVLAGVLTMLLASAAAGSLAPRLPGGDEPHYLIITQSLLEDGDLRIENNHRARDYAAYFSGTLDPDFIQRGRGGVIYSIHAPGLPVLAAPLFALFGYRGAQATVMLLASLAGALIWFAGWTATDRRSAAWFAWAAVVCSTTFLVQSVTIFPDGPAEAAVAFAAIVLISIERGRFVSRARLVVLSVALGALPFLHTRFVAASAGLALAVIWHVAVDRRQSWRARSGRLAAFLAVPVLAGLAWFAYFAVLYGSPNPAVVYGAHPETNPAYVPGGIAGVLFDQQFGLITFAPVLALGIVGWFGRRTTTAVSGRSLVPAVVVYLAAVGTYWMWWAGVPATPARFAAAILPAFAAPLASFWRRSGQLGRTTAVALLAITAATSLVVLGVDRGVLAWNQYDAHAAWLEWMGSVAHVTRVWPSFFWNLTPGIVRSERPFFVHLGFWGATIGAVSLVASAVVRDPRVGRSSGTVAVWALAIALMAGAEGSWWLVHASPLAATSSQVRVLARGASGATVRRLVPWQWPHRAAAPAVEVIDVPRVDLAGSAAVEWDDVEELPAGDYTLRVLERRPHGGALTVRLGRDPFPYRVFALQHLSEQDVALRLPAGARALTFAPDETLASAASGLELRPLRVEPPVAPPAEANVSMNDIDVFSSDDAVYLESGGFWVKRGETTDVTVADPSPTSGQIVLSLGNGNAANVAVIESGGHSDRLPLAAGEQVERFVRLDARGEAHLRLTSTSGFRPADDGVSRDARNLGVRVVVRRAATGPPAAASGSAR